MFKQKAIRAVAAVAFSATAVLGVATPASAAPSQPDSFGILAGCGAVFNNVKVDGGAASWNISCTNGTNARIEGFVEDTKADGKCAQVKAFANNGESRVPLAKACPKGTKTNFDWKTSGATDITAYLFTA
ncbi:hypothetical protein [Micromonospora chokoriensis]|uniref:Secreted protein n=1 Tax=Micromonospora chokoriensis TaxID=356851 RepID=A0A1C4Y7R5_9ACTN|nr:hypothetical protein [Micromonospora chokoriensis]SCF16686.1 hypothetical protein GA0070612_4385 [Micromonospora chokoriensis]